MNKLIIDFFMYLFESLLLFHYANSLFEAKTKKSICFLVSFSLNIILMIVYQFQIVYLNGILLMVVYFLFFVLLYNASIKSAIFHALIFIIVMFATEVLVMEIGTIFFSDFNAMNNDKNAYLYVIVTSKLLHITIIMILAKFFAHKSSNNTNIGGKYYWLLFILPVSSILMVLSFRYVAYTATLTPTMNVLWTVASTLVVFANIVVFIIYEYSQKNAVELYDLKVLNLQEEQDKKYYELVEQSNNDMRVFAHDIKNHLVQMRNMDDVVKIHSYIDTLAPAIEKFNYIGVSKNKMLDLIISKYSRICELNHIQFRIDVKTANLNYIKDADLSTLMNNLLDNAVEAANNSIKKFVNVSIFSRNEQYDGLVIINSCDNPPTEKDGTLLTTKSNKRIHGLGTSSIKKIVKKYNAIYDWKYDKDNKTFETDIAFKK